MEFDVGVSGGASDADHETDKGEYRKCVEKPIGCPPGREAGDEQQRRYGAHPEQAWPARRIASHRRPSAAKSTVALARGSGSLPLLRSRHRCRLLMKPQWARPSRALLRLRGEGITASGQRFSSPLRLRTRSEPELFCQAIWHRPQETSYPTFSLLRLAPALHRGPYRWVIVGFCEDHPDWSGSKRSTNGRNAASISSAVFTKNSGSRPHGSSRSSRHVGAEPFRAASATATKPVPRR